MRPLITALLLGVVSVAGWWWLGARDSEAVPDLAESQRVANHTADRFEHDSGLERAGSDEQPHGWSADGTCLTAAQLDSHPLLIQDAMRFQSVSMHGGVLEPYRGLSVAELESLAAQGDSVAMAVRGAVSLMRSRKHPESQALSYLQLEDPTVMAYRVERPHSQEFLIHLAEARHWFYQAALHGRLQALSEVGDALQFEIGGAVALGWISQEEYDALGKQAQMSLMPGNVYSSLVFEIAPELQTGPIGEILNSLRLKSDRQFEIAQMLKEQFLRDQEEAGLPPVRIPVSDVPSFENLRELLCEGELENLKEF